MDEHLRRLRNIGLLLIDLYPLLLGLRHLVLPLHYQRQHEERERMKEKTFHKHRNSSFSEHFPEASQFSTTWSAAACHRTPNTSTIINLYSAIVIQMSCWLACTSSTHREVPQFLGSPLPDRHNYTLCLPSPKSANASDPKSYLMKFPYA